MLQLLFVLCATITTFLVSVGVVTDIIAAASSARTVDMTGIVKRLSKSAADMLQVHTLLAMSIRMASCAIDGTCGC